MERNESLFERIEKYLNRSMLPSEMQSFEKEVAANPDLGLELEMHRSERDAVELLIEENLRNKIKGWRNKGNAPEAPLPKKGGKRGGLTWLAIILSGILLSGAGSWYFWLRDSDSVGTPSEENTVPGSEILQQNPIEVIQNESNTIQNKNENYIKEPQASIDFQDVFRETYQRMEADEITRQYSGLTKAPEDLLNKASAAYAAQKNKEVIALLAPVDGGNQYQLLLQMLGHAYLQEGDFVKAEDCFNRLIKSGDDTDGTEWYLLLSKVGQGAVNDAVFVSLLKKMKEDTNHSYHANAVRLQSKLR